MTVCVLFGFVYLGWIAWTEGWGFWLVAGLAALVGLIGLVLHRAMDAARSR